MRKETISRDILIADEGMVLTNGIEYATERLLFDNESEKDWHEITEEEYAEILKAEENIDEFTALE